MPDLGNLAFSAFGYLRRLWGGPPVRRRPIGRRAPSEKRRPAAGVRDGGVPRRPRACPTTFPQIPYLPGRKQEAHA